MSFVTDDVIINRIIFRDQVFEKDYVGTAVDELARYLDKNIRSNSPIVYLVAPNHIKTIVAFLAVCKTGRATLLVDPKTGRLEYEEMLADTRPGAIITVDPETLSFDFGKEIAPTDYEMSKEEIAQLEDVCVMLYSNAEDGFAKAAMLTHKNILSNAKSIIRGTQLCSQSISCALIPYHHLYGFQAGILTPFISGGSLLVSELSDVSTIAGFAENMHRWNATHIYTAPLVFYLLSKSSYMGLICRQLPMLLSGGYKLFGVIRNRFEQKFGISIHEGYGLTEASPVCTLQSKGKSYDTESIGLPMNCCRIEIFDEKCAAVPVHEKGEICIQGENVMKGYFNNPTATRRAIKDGWLHSGDFGAMDEKGNVFFKGLKKAMYNVGGNKVYPRELERLLMKNGIIKKIELSSTYDDIRGDLIKAKIECIGTGQFSVLEFKMWCAQNISGYKIPQRIEML